MATTVQISPGTGPPGERAVRRGQRGWAGLVGSPADGGLIGGPDVASETCEPPAGGGAASGVAAFGSPPDGWAPSAFEHAISMKRDDVLYCGPHA